MSRKQKNKNKNNSGLKVLLAVLIILIIGASVLLAMKIVDSQKDEVMIKNN